MFPNRVRNLISREQSARRLGRETNRCESNASKHIAMYKIFRARRNSSRGFFFDKGKQNYRLKSGCIWLAIIPKGDHVGHLKGNMPF